MTAASSPAPGARIRLCKGAYDEPASVAYPRAAEVTDSYLRCLRVLMAGAGYPMVASHDPEIIEAVPALAARHGRGADDFEYQMLYGIRDDEQRRLAEAGNQRAGVRAVRQPVVRLLHAPAGRTSGQPDVLPARAGQQDVARRHARRPDVRLAPWWRSSRIVGSPGGSRR